MTNGEKIINDFPYIEIKDQNKVFTTIQIDTTGIGIPIIVYTEWWNKWWNAEYKEPTTKNDLALIHTEGLDEGIRCAMCTNSIKSDRGCDGSCAVNNAMYKEVMDVIENHITDTDKMIEPTTKNNLEVDCVSRKEVEKLVFRFLQKGTDENIAFYEHFLDLPSVTPQEPRWIPCSERLPENKETVLVTFKHFVSGNTIGLGSMILLRGKPHWHVREQNLGTYDVLAWMPLPKSYSEVEE